MKENIDYDKLSSLLLFWYFPAEWWKRRHWLVRLIWASLLLAMVSAASIAMYDSVAMREVKRLNEIQRQQIGELAKVIAEVKGERATVESKREDKVLNEIVDLQESLRNLQTAARGLDNADFSQSVEEALAALEASGSADR